MRSATALIVMMLLGVAFLAYASDDGIPKPPEPGPIPDDGIPKPPEPGPIPSLFVDGTEGIPKPPEPGPIPGPIRGS